MPGGRPPIPTDTLRKCKYCDYVGRVDTFPPSRRKQDGTLTYRTECRTCYNAKNQARRQRKPTTINHGRRADLVDMVKFLTRPLENITPQERLKVADIIVAHYRVPRGEANHYITRVLRANGRTT